MRSLLLVIYCLSSSTLFSQSDWSVYVALRNEIGRFNQFDQLDPPPRDFLVSPEIQLERVLTRKKAVTSLTFSTALQRFQATDSHFFWAHESLQEDYRLTNLIVGVGFLSTIRPEARFQLLGGAKASLGIPLQWQYEMNNLQRPGFDHLTGMITTPVDVPQVVMIRNNLHVSAIWQATAGLQYQMSRSLYLRGLFSFGNGRQQSRPFQVEGVETDYVQLLNLATAVSLGLVHKW